MIGERGNLALHEAKAAGRAREAEEKELRDAERDAKLAELRLRAQAAASDAYKIIREYAAGVRLGMSQQCERLDPVKEGVALARHQGGIQFIDGMLDFFEKATREQVELEKQTTG